MAKLSLSMIVKNEEETILRVLSCAKTFCDELVVIDTGSTDKTVELAKEAGAEVYFFDWIDDFAAARNFALEKCSNDWVIWLDADDIISEEHQAKLKNLKDTVLNDEKVNILFLPYERDFAEDGSCTFSVIRERLFRKSANYHWVGVVHEVVPVDYSKSLTFNDIKIQHKKPSHLWERQTDRNIRILEKAVQSGDLSPRTLFYYSNELKGHGKNIEAIEYYEKYIQVSTIDWEKYYALTSIAACYKALDQKDKWLEYNTKAMIFDSTRAEAFVQVGLYFYERAEWKKAIPFFQAASVLKKPDHGFNSDSSYTWLPLDYLSICLDRIGDYYSSINTVMKIMPISPEKPRLKKNLQWLIDQL
jgi:glycosyltransferase involved in cell wall biosynthesis